MTDIDLSKLVSHAETGELCFVRIRFHSIKDHPKINAVNQRLCSRLTALWRYINFVLLLLLLLLLCVTADAQVSVHRCQWLYGDTGEYRQHMSEHRHHGLKQ